MMQTYRPPATWWRCDRCEVRWDSVTDCSCWVCGGPGIRSWKPTLTSQYGF